MRITARRTRRYNAEVSPDGRWLAYESGSDIWVRPFPDVLAGAWQVSFEGGTRPLWSRSSDELFYVTRAGSLMSVAVQPGTSFVYRTSETLFTGYPPQWSESPRYYDVAKDGRFLFIKRGSMIQTTGEPAHITIVQNWVRALERHAR